MKATGYQAPQDPKAKTIQELLDEDQEEKDLEFMEDPLWYHKLPVIVSKTGSRKGLFIFLGSFVLLVTILTVLKNYGIIGQ